MFIPISYHPVFWHALKTFPKDVITGYSCSRTSDISFDEFCVVILNNKDLAEVLCEMKSKKCITIARHVTLDPN